MFLLNLFYLYNENITKLRYQLNKMVGKGLNFVVKRGLIVDDAKKVHWYSILCNKLDMIAIQRHKEWAAEKIVHAANILGMGYAKAQIAIEENNDNLLREIIVENQALQRNNKDNLFYYAANGDLDELSERLDAIEIQIKRSGTKLRHSEVYKTDVAGANIVHTAYMAKQYDVGHYLVQRYPDLASRPYSDRTDYFNDDFEPGSPGEIAEVVDELARETEHENVNDNVLENKMNRLKLCMTNKEIIERMPYVGENILHMVIVRRNYEEVRWLLDFYQDHRHSFPRGLVRLLNSNTTGKFFDRGGDLYFGGYPLQFAVCANDIPIFDLVYSFASGAEFFVDNSKADSTASTGVTGIGPNVIFATDSAGNNVLHLCALHSLTEMYEHVFSTALKVMRRELRALFARNTQSGFPVGKIVHGLKKLETGYSAKGYIVRSKVLHHPSREKLDDWVDGEAHRKVDERLVLALNEDFFSPLTLAASIIQKKTDTAKITASRVKMFEFLLLKMKKLLWMYGPVHLSLIDLEGIEINYNVADHYQIEGREEKVQRAEMESAMNWLCINDADSAVLIPEVKKLIQTKWQRVGYPFFMLSFFLHSSLTVMVTLILIFVNAVPTPQPRASGDYVVNVLYPIVCLCYFAMFVQETYNAFYYNTQFWNLRGIPVYDKLLKTAKMLAFVAFCFCKGFQEHRTHKGPVAGDRYEVQNDRSDEGAKIALTLCIISSWMHLYYFLMGFDSTGPFVLTISRIVSKDVPYFFKFYSIVVVAFACALSVLSNNGNNAAWYGFFHLIKAIWTLIQDTINMRAISHDYTNHMQYYPRHLQWLADILLTVYYISVVLLMLNLLIAMINVTYIQYSSYNDAILLIAKYDIMNAMEQEMSPDELKGNRGKYTLIDDTEMVESHFGSNPEQQPQQQPQSSTIATSDTIPTSPSSPPSSHSSQLAPSSSSASSFSPSAAARQQQQQQQRPLSMRYPRAPAHGWQDRHERLKVSRYRFELQTVQDQWWESKQRQLDAQSNQYKYAITHKTALFIVDPQNDFHTGGSLPVGNAVADSKRIANMIDRYGAHIHEIFVSLDSHHTCHIAHALSWVNEQGEHPAPFTQISHDDVVNKRWMHVHDSPQMKIWVRVYTGALERKNRPRLTIWPEHCVIGSKGHGVVPVINTALQRWASKSKRQVNYIMKGQNLRTECYSALQAEVEDSSDQSTALNSQLLSRLKISDRVQLLLLLLLL
jgi:nicotinamidase/pyrazinamidase